MTRFEEVYILWVMGKLPEDPEGLNEWLSKENLDDLAKLFDLMGNFGNVPGGTFLRNCVARQIVCKDAEFKHLSNVLKAVSCDGLTGVEGLTIMGDLPVVGVKAVGEAYLWLATGNSSFDNAEISRRLELFRNILSRGGSKVLDAWKEKRP